MSSEWLEKQIERRLEAEQLARCDAHLDEGVAPEKCEPEVIWQDIRKALESDLQKPLSGAQRELIENFFERNRFDAAGESAEKERKEAISKWNDEWSRSYARAGRLPPGMSMCSFTMRDLSGIDLSNADLSHKEGLPSNHAGAELSNARLSWTDFSGTNLSQAVLRNASLDNAFLVGTALGKADLRGADLSYADLRDADLTEADLTGATLTHANLTGAKLFHAKLDQADLRFARGVTFDENSVINTKFTNRAGMIWRVYLMVFKALAWTNRRLSFGVKDLLNSPIETEDSWSALRRSYSGPSFFISLLFFVAFLLPYLAQIFLLVQVSRGEGALVSTVESVTGQQIANVGATLEEAAAARADVVRHYSQIIAKLNEAADAAHQTHELLLTLTDQPILATVLAAKAEAAVAADALLQLKRESLELRDSAKRWTAVELRSRRYPVWQLLLGIDSKQRSWTALMLLLLVYNGLKWFLTIAVAPMRDAEERSQMTPAKIEYIHLVWLHVIVSALYWLSLVVAVYTFTKYMLTPVYKVW